MATSSALELKVARVIQIPTVRGQAGISPVGTIAVVCPGIGRPAVVRIWAIGPWRVLSVGCRRGESGKSNHRSRDQCMFAHFVLLLDLSELEEALSPERRI